MKIALTKDKVVDVKLPKWLSASHSAGVKDVVGIEFNTGNPQGCPAVRLVKKASGYAVLAAGFIPPPEGNLPEKWEETPHQPSWTLPMMFQGPNAAISVCSPDMFLRQTTLDVLTASGEAAAMQASAKPASGAKPGLRLAPKKAEPAKAAVASEADLFKPVSVNGTRSIAIPLDEKPFILEAGLPEYQVLWLSRLLPEGKRPTAASIQISPASALSAVLSLPDFVAVGGTALVVFVFRSSIVFAGYRNGALLLFRECPGVAGYDAIRASVKDKLGLEDNLVDSVLDDTLIDPRPALEPFVRPVLQQAEISLDYLTRRHALKISKIFLMGLPSGAHYWSQMAQESLRVPFLSPSVFDGLALPSKAGRMPALTASQSQTFLAALGAARAAMEVRS